MCSIYSLSRTDNTQTWFLAINARKYNIHAVFSSELSSVIITWHSGVGKFPAATKHMSENLTEFAHLT